MTTKYPHPKLRNYYEAHVLAVLMYALQTNEIMIYEHTHLWIHIHLLQMCGLVGTMRLEGKLQQRQSQKDSNKIMQGNMSLLHLVTLTLVESSVTWKLRDVVVSVSCSVNKPQIGRITEKLLYPHALMESQTHIPHTKHTLKYYLGRGHGIKYK